MSEASFGVGCFHFGLDREIPFTFVGSQYIEEVQHALEAIPAIGTIEINDSAPLSKQSLLIDEPWQLIQDGPDYFPPLQGAQFRFDIHIPTRVQRDAMGDYRDLIVPGVEDFTVVVKSSWLTPVAFVRPLTEESVRASWRTRAVREFLRREFERVDTGSIRFEFLGPTPFYPDFYLRPSEETTETGSLPQGPFGCVISEDAYRVTFYYKQSQFATVDEAMGPLFEMLSEELGLMYYIVQTRNSSFRGWAGIEELASTLVAAHRARGMSRRIANLFRTTRDLDEAYLRLAEFGAEELRNRGGVESTYRSLYNPARFQTHLRTYIDEEMTERHDVPLEQTQAILDLLSRRTTKLTDNLVLIGAAFISGVLGGLLAGMATG